MTQTVNETPSLPISDGTKLIDGKTYMGDGKGGWQPLEGIKARDKLEDEVVRDILNAGIPLSDDVTGFKVFAFDKVRSLDALLAQEYQAKLGGKKGNATLMTVDGLGKVEVRVADLVDFGPSLHTAKLLIDECLVEWSAESRPEIRAIVTNAFNTEKEGNVNQSEVIKLLRLDIDDERWLRAMDAIRDAMRVVGSKSYIRCFRRAAHDAAWEPITIDLAKA